MVFGGKTQTLTVMEVDSPKYRMLCSSQLAVRPSAAAVCPCIHQTEEISHGTVEALSMPSYSYSSEDRVHGQIFRKRSVRQRAAVRRVGEE